MGGGKTGVTISQWDQFSDVSKNFLVRFLTYDIFLVTQMPKKCFVSGLSKDKI